MTLLGFHPDVRGSARQEHPSRGVGRGVILFAGLGLATALSLWASARGIDWYVFEAPRFYKYTIIASVLQLVIAIRRSARSPLTVPVSPLAWFTPMFIWAAQTMFFFLWSAQSITPMLPMVLVPPLTCSVIGALTLAGCFLSEAWARESGRRVRAPSPAVPLPVVAAMASAQWIWWLYISFGIPLDDRTTSSSLRIERSYWNEEVSYDAPDGVLTFGRDGAMRYSDHQDSVGIMSVQERSAPYRFLDPTHVQVSGFPGFAKPVTLEVRNDGRILLLGPLDDSIPSIRVYVSN